MGKMRTLLSLVLGILVITATGCSLVSVERYVHEPTKELPNYLWSNQALPKSFIPKKGEVLMVPDFTTFSTSFAGQRSHLKVFTREKRPLTFVSATLEASESGEFQALSLSVSTDPVRLEKGEEVWVAYVTLFVDDRTPDRNCSFERFRGAAQLQLTICWRDGGDIREQRFTLKKVVRKETAWVT